MSNTRARKMAETIKEQVSEIINNRVKDPKLGFTTVTGVETSKDVRYCKVFISVLGTSEQQDETLAVLERAAGFIRTELGSKIRIRHVPEIRFQVDRSMQHGMHINEILQKIQDGSSDDGPAE
jgi:ribosome-binding factor A